MSLQLVLVCFFLASGCLSFEAIAVDYDYLQAVFQWPKAFCINSKVKCISNLPDNFTMHGLWPSNMTQSGRPTVRIDGSDCQLQNNLPPFKSEKLMGKPPIIAPPNRTLVSDLEIHWPNLDQTKGKLWLWSHEYERHGICMDKQLNGDQNAYFRMGLEIKKQNDIKEWFREENITPNASKRPPLQKFINAIQKKIHHKPVITCYNKLYLHEIRLCYNEDGTARMDCDSKIPNNLNPNEKCFNNVVYL